MPERKRQRRRARPPRKARIYRNPTSSRVSDSLIMPNHKIVRLGYPSEFVLSTAGTVFNKRFNTNAALTPEVGAATKPNGFAQMATFYNQYRVLSFSFKWFVSNNETFPVYVYFVNSNTDPGTGATGTVIGRRHSGFKELSGKGGMDKATFTYSSTIDKIIGQNTRIDDKYSALANTIPADVTWLALGSQSSGGANLTNGTSWFGLLTMVVKFYDLLPI